MKVCRRCGITKPLSEFHKHPKSADRLQRECKACTLVRLTAWKKENPDKERAHKRAWQHKNVDKHRASQKRSRDKQRAEVEALRARVADMAAQLAALQSIATNPKDD